MCKTFCLTCTVCNNYCLHCLLFFLVFIEPGFYVVFDLIMMPWYIKTLSLLNHLLSFLNLGMFLRKCFYRNKKNLFFGSKMGGGSTYTWVNTVIFLFFFFFLLLFYKVIVSWPELLEAWLALTNVNYHRLYRF